MIRVRVPVLLAVAASTMSAQSAQTPATIGATPIFGFPAPTPAEFVRDVAGSPGAKLIYFVVGDAVRVYDRAAKTTRDVVKGRYTYVANSAAGDRLVLLRAAEDAKADEQNPKTFVWTVAVNPTTGRAAGEPRRVSVTPAMVARFSPDGKQIAFIATGTPASNGTPAVPRKMIVMPTNGGEERVLFERGGPRGPLQWSPDGKWLYFAQASQRQDAPTVVSRVSVAGGTPTPITAPMLDSYIGLSPDGGSIIGTTRLNAVGATLGVFDTLKNLKAEMTLKVPGDGEPFGGAWAGDAGRVVVAIGNAKGAMHTLSIVDGTVKSIRPQLAAEALRVPTLSPDGKHFAMLGPGDATIWSVTLTNADGSGARRLHGVTAGDIGLAAWSPDGGYVLFPGDQHKSMYVAEVSTGKITKVGSATLAANGKRWRDDGKAIWYTRINGTPTAMQVEIRESLLDGTDRLVRDLTPLLPAQGEAGFGTTGIAVSDSEAYLWRTGALVNLKTGAKRQIFDDGRADGLGTISLDYRAYVRPALDKKSLEVRTFDGKTRLTVRMPSGALVESYALASLTSSLIVTVLPSAGSVGKIYALPLDGSAPRTLLTLKPGETFNDFSLSPDGKTIVYVTLGALSMDFVDVDLGPTLRALPPAKR